MLLFSISSRNPWVVQRPFQCDVFSRLACLGCLSIARSALQPLWFALQLPDLPFDLSGLPFSCQICPLTCLACLSSCLWGLQDTNKVLAISRIMVAWQPLGLAMGTYDMCNRYLQQRQQFGSPLAAFQVRL